MKVNPCLKNVSDRTTGLITMPLLRNSALSAANLFMPAEHVFFITTKDTNHTKWDISPAYRTSKRALVNALKFRVFGVFRGCLIWVVIF